MTGERKSGMCLLFIGDIKFSSEIKILNMVLGQQIVLVFLHYKIILNMTSIKYKHNLLQGRMC